MIRYFRVAELFFSLDLPDDHLVWDQLHNYEPVACPLRPGDAPIFELVLSPEPPEGERTPVYVPEVAPGEPVVRLFRYGEREWLSEFAPVPSRPICGQLVFSEDFRSGRLWACGSDSDQAFAINNAVMLLFAFASAPFRALELHASVVMHGGRGFLFLGRSGTGKSTHSRLWMRYIPQTELLNDDNPVLRVLDSCIRVYGSPWSGKTPCYKAQDVPVGAIVRLRQAPYNAIARLGVTQSYTSLMASCSGFRPIRQIADAQHGTLEAVVAGVPCYQLECLPDEAAARLCQQTVDG